MGQGNLGIKQDPTRSAMICNLASFLTGKVFPAVGLLALSYFTGVACNGNHPGLDRLIRGHCRSGSR